MDQEAIVRGLQKEHNDFVLKLQKQHAQEMRDQLQDFLGTGKALKTEPGTASASGKSTDSKKRKHSSTTTATSDIIPSSYSPVPLSERTLSMVKDKLEIAYRNKSGKMPAFDPEKSHIAYLPINDEETRYALFYRKDNTKPFGPSNCTAALAGWVSRCCAANSVGVCHKCAGALYRLIDKPKDRNRIWQLSGKKDNQCIVPEDATIIKDFNGAPLPALVKSEPATPSVHSEPAPKKSKKKSSSSHSAIKYTDGFDTAKGNEKERKWKSWGEIQEYNPDGKTLKPRKVDALYDITEDGKIYLAIGTPMVAQLSDNWCDASDRLPGTRIEHMYTPDGNESKVAKTAHVFRASRIQKVMLKFKAVSGEPLYKDVLTNDMMKALTQ